MRWVLRDIWLFLWWVCVEWWWSLMSVSQQLGNGTSSSPWSRGPRSCIGAWCQEAELELEEWWWRGCQRATVVWWLSFPQPECAKDFHMWNTSIGIYTCHIWLLGCWVNAKFSKGGELEWYCCKSTERWGTISRAISHRKFRVFENFWRTSAE